MMLKKALLVFKCERTLYGIMYVKWSSSGYVWKCGYVYKMGGEFCMQVKWAVKCITYLKWCTNNIYVCKMALGTKIGFPSLL